MEKRYIYADNAATTAVSENVLNTMMPFLTTQYGNPSSIYKLGRDAQKVVEEAREKAAAALGCNPNDCGTPCRKG